MNWWWLSFATDDEFLGAVIVGPAAHIGQALVLAELLEIAPKQSEVAGVELLEDIIERVPEKWREKLLSKSQCRELDSIMCPGDEMSEQEREELTSEILEGAEENGIRLLRSRG